MWDWIVIVILDNSSSTLVALLSSSEEVKVCTQVVILHQKSWHLSRRLHWIRFRCFESFKEINGFCNTILQLQVINEYHLIFVSKFRLKHFALKEPIISLSKCLVQNLMATCMSDLMRSGIDHGIILKHFSELAAWLLIENVKETWLEWKLWLQSPLTVKIFLDCLNI
jgi:hypothetical protein